MKKAGALAAASAAAASTSVALSTGADRCAVPAPLEKEGSSLPSTSKEAGSGSRNEQGGNKFAPRFDGLRFIETLVTAHR